MADYTMAGNLWTSIFLLVPTRGTGNYTYRKLPYELCRFNADTNPSAVPVIVPDGDQSVQPTADNRIYEKIWFVEQTPYVAKVSFGKIE